MPIGTINAAKFIARELPAPFEELLGGEHTHRIFNRAHANWCTPPGHHTPWHDCYTAADMLLLPQKARLFLGPAGKPLTPPTTCVRRASLKSSKRSSTPCGPIGKRTA
ncbi:hypothetical protein [Streptomyces sp. NPDC015125]|uniref:hypothetical protein n=1 Tax=Streptomyces sp. NPDC015125 TaxID=3364938 RepID=UPI003702BE17